MDYSKLKNRAEVVVSMIVPYMLKGKILNLLIKYFSLGKNLESSTSSLVIKANTSQRLGLGLGSLEAT